ncbi:MAG: helix-turn-helix domain-containing protein [Lachnospiraceae bacterium]|nr:helix-turn-helix domain-containing protein [Lachnospiraceae bacterium]
MAATDEKISEAGSYSNQPYRDVKTYSVQDIAEILRISRSKAYELCMNPEFKVIRLGRTIRISKQSFDEWLNNLL